jgi:hypothetical protein
MSVDLAGPWVDVGFHDGDSYDQAMAASDDGWDIDKLAEYLAQWDFGDETDGAHTRDEAPWGEGDRVYEVEIGGLDYILTTNHHFGYVSLNRRPLKEFS